MIGSVHGRSILHTFYSLLGFVLIAFSSIVTLVLVYRMWSTIQDGFARTSPDSAVGLLFVPFYNIYQLFRSFWGFAQDFNSYRNRHSLQTPALPTGLFLTFCILSIFGWIPLSLIAPAILFVYMFMIAKICDAINSMPALGEHQKEQVQVPIASAGGVSMSGRTFVERYLGIIFFGMACLFCFRLSLISPIFYVIDNIRSILVGSSILGVLAAAVALTSRAKGPDISLGAVMALGAYVAVSQPSWLFGLLLAILVGGVIGAVNGAFCVFARVPSVLVTLISGILLRQLVMQLSNRLILAKRIARLELPTFILVWLAVAAITFGIILFTRLGKPMLQRTKTEQRSVPCFWAFVIAGGMAGVAGTVMLMRMNNFDPQIGIGYEPFLLFVWAFISCSSLFDRKAAPALVSMAAALLCGILQFEFSWFSEGMVIQKIFLAILCLALLLPAALRWWWHRNPQDAKNRI